ncbi:MAG TPA: hypothetical protein VMV18_00830, partial [bacterium]|nr:hypothetical protein [bacterium]
LFNMLPAFPSDGGRIVRAIFWGISGDFRRATRWAAGLGIGLASLLVAGGIALAVTASARDTVDLAGSRLGGAWMAMIGFYLVRSARAGVTQARVSEAIRAAKVGDVMLAVRPLVPAEKTLFQVFTEFGGPSAAEMLLGFPVASAGACIGYVEPDDLLRVPREEWHTVTAAQVMKPIEQVPRLDVAEPLDRLVRAIVADGAAGGLVFSGGSLVGYASRADVARFLVEAREDTAADPLRD